MKRLVAALAVSLTLPLAAAGQKPGMEAFFDAMAIGVKPGQQRQYVVGDNLDSYFEGYTQTYKRGGGYGLFQGYASYANGRLNNRARSSEQVLPYGHRVRHAGGATEEMALLSKRRAVAVRVMNKNPATLAVDAMLTVGRDAVAIGRDGDLVVVAQQGTKARFLALAADRPVAIDGLKMTTVRPATSLTVVAALGDSPQEAARRARELASIDAIGQEKAVQYKALTKSYLHTSDAEYNKALNWSKAASKLFVVEEFGTGIWAGLPWFRDNWGRDTFIALPGTLLVSGEFVQARAVLANFARYQNLRTPRDKEYGRIPNRVAAGDSIIYNTVDGTPWMLREALEYIRYTGDREFAAQAYRLAVPYFDGAIANYMDRDGLLAHDDADTWMDARIDGKQPWSARGPRAVEIQALWYTALQTGAYLAAEAGDAQRAKQWTALAQNAQRSFQRLFWDGSVMADRLRDDASRDTKVRPNQLMLVSIPFDDFVPPEVQAKVTRNAVAELLYPYGIASLSQDDSYFHPRHENPAFHHKDAAYHQGTVWGWNAGFTVSALNKFGYQDHAWALTRNLGQQILGLGTLGNMSELLDALPDAQGKPKPSGTYAQSWSVAEFARNGYQDYVGFRPNLLENTLAFNPAIPAAWKNFYAVLPFGADEELEADFASARGEQRWSLRLNGKTARKVEFTFLAADRSRARVGFELAPGRNAVLTLRDGTATLDGAELATTPAQASFAATIGTLRFRPPKPYRPQDFPMLKGKGVLKGIVERNQYR